MGTWLHIYMYGNHRNVIKVILRFVIFFYNKNMHWFYTERQILFFSGLPLARAAIASWCVLTPEPHSMHP